MGTRRCSGAIGRSRLERKAQHEHSLGNVGVSAMGMAMAGNLRARAEGLTVCDSPRAPAA